MHPTTLLKISIIQYESICQTNFGKILVKTLLVIMDTCLHKLGFHPNRIKAAMQSIEDKNDLNQVIKEIDHQRILKLLRTMHNVEELKNLKQKEKNNKSHRYHTGICPLCLKLALTINPNQPSFYKDSQFYCNKCLHHKYIDKRLKQIKQTRININRKMDVIKHRNIINMNQDKDIKLKLRQQQKNISNLKDSISNIMQQNESSSGSVHNFY